MDQKAINAHRAATRAAKSNANHLQRLLREPQRQAAEERFALAHEQDSDQTLYAYVKEEKRRRGRQMKPANTVGYCFLIQRLGPWQDFIGRINQELAAEKQSPAGG